MFVCVALFSPLHWDLLSEGTDKLLSVSDHKVLLGNESVQKQQRVFSKTVKYIANPLDN
jgi:hypothetical protein